MVDVTCEFDAAPDLDCCWPISDADCPCEAAEGADPEMVQRMAEIASSMLTRLSGYTVGQCATTIRPLDICPVCRSWCCGGADSIRLVGPNDRRVTAVDAVHIGEETLDPSEYRWDPQYGVLWRVPPETWPTRDARWAECGEPGAFCIDAVVGTAPDAWALRVAATLMCELVASCTGGKCRLPRNTTQVSAQGITIQLQPDEITYMIPEVAAWVAAVNPHGARLPGAVFSPELSRSGSGSPLGGWAHGWAAPWSGGCCG